MAKVYKLHKPNAVYSVAKGTDTTQPAAKGKALNLSLQRRPETRDAVYNFINLYKYDKSLYDFSRSRSAKPEGKAKGYGQGRWEFSVGKMTSDWRLSDTKTKKHQVSSSRAFMADGKGPKNKNGK